MAVKFKDYYEILGVPRDASDADLKRAFRHLARRYHPDVARNSRGAEDRFKEVNEAYEVLGDPVKRHRYDRLGNIMKEGMEYRASPAWQKADHAARAKTPEPPEEEVEFRGTGYSDFFEQLFGTREERQARAERPQPEPEDGYSPPRGADLRADLLVSLEEAVRGAVRPLSLRFKVPCSLCQGSGRSLFKKCPECEGEGHTVRVESHQVKIPAGVLDGQRLRLPGRGQPGLEDAAGDLYLRVRLARHPEFEVQQDDLASDLVLAPWEAVLGANVSVPTLEGSVSIRIPPGSREGQRLRVRGEGLGKAGSRGDLYVTLRVETPTHLNEEERRLWEQLANRSVFRPREESAP